MEEKTYSVCLGRFQPFHNGHLKCVKEALNNSDKLLIVIGSSQESRTERNPFSLLERKTMIKEIFKNEGIDLNRIEFIGLDDLNSLNLKEWGLYLYYNVINKIHTKNFTYVCGDEYDLNDWFNEDVIANLECIYVHRYTTTPSATKVRKAILENDFDYIKENLNKYLIENFLFLKDVLLSVSKGSTPILQSVLPSTRF